MKNLFYATRIDSKTGHRLTTSYNNQRSSDMYGGKDSTQAETLYYAEFGDDMRRLRISEKPEQSDAPIMRSSMVNSGKVENTSSGRFVLWGKRDGVWTETPFRFSQYGSANTTMKAMIGMYEAIAILTSGDENVDERVAARDEDEPFPSEL